MNIAGFIWNIADDVLRGVYVRGKYRDIILPMTVIRRLDAVLEPTKAAVLAKKAELDGLQLSATAQEPALSRAAGQAFHNGSPFTLKQLLSRPNPATQRADFEAYLDGFSTNVRDIIDQFGFRKQIDKLEASGILHALIEKFCDDRVNLSPSPVRDGDGRIRLPALDNHTMGTLFEELLRKFNEENNEEAGEHFTPRDVIELMADLVFRPVADKIGDSTYLLYDDACGTGGMLTVGEVKLGRMAAKAGKKAEIHLYGQEVNAETYAICKADLLIKGEGAEAMNIALGSTPFSRCAWAERAAFRFHDGQSSVW
jgi:type I restriction enzyme M protein